MCWVISIIFGLVMLFEILKWFFNEALPWVFRHIGMFIDWAKEVISGVFSWSVTAWKALAGWVAARSGTTPVGGQEADQSLLDSSAASAIDMQANISQPSIPMWPFTSDKDEPFKPVIPSAAGQPRPSPSATPSVQAVQLQAELNKAKHELAKAHETLATWNSLLKSKDDELAKIFAVIVDKDSELNTLGHQLLSLKQQLECAQGELEQLRPFAAVKSEARRVTYTVSPELHKKWQSIMRDTTRLQVVELLGQPSEILTVTEAGAVSPIQMVRKSAPAPRKELCDHVMSLVGMDLRLRELLRGSGCTAWVYSDDTLAPGVIFFSTESVGGQISRIFPPEC